ncbi:MAG: threonine-phosphate decarboxylase [Candidatus Methanoperedens sp.]|nr:threonine-phosphate decarboxylase [Candidatus Methanoperedens sp.]
MIISIITMHIIYIFFSFDLRVYSNLIIPANKKGHVPLKDRVKRTAIELTPCVHGAKCAESAEKSGKRACELIDFSVNLNPLGPPKLKKILTNAYGSLGSYPDNRYGGFKKAASDSLSVKPENIIPGNGSTELIRLFAETVIEPGDRILIPVPTFGEYEFQCRLFGGKIEHVDYRKITEIRPQDYKAVFLCNPNNPTGRLIKRREILQLAKKCVESSVFLFVDEAFIELSDPQESIADFAALNDFVIVLRSLTKIYAVPGLRIGFAVASPDFACILNNIRLPWNLNSLALESGIWLLKNNGDYIDRSLGLIKKEREWLMTRLGSIRGFRPCPSDSNFILVDIREFSIDSADMTARMLRHGIIIRDCSSFGLKNHIRVAVRKRGDNRKLIKAFGGVISEWGSELAKNAIGKALEKGVTARSRIDCEYYPCHFEGQDCTFCFCPFYPCENNRTGGELIHRPAGGTVWSCAKCDVIHRWDIAEKVLRALMEGKKIKDVWELVVEPVL